MTIPMAVQPATLSQRLAQMLEQFLRQTGIAPADAVLYHQTKIDPDGSFVDAYWYEHRIPVPMAGDVVCPNCGNLRLRASANHLWCDRCGFTPIAYPPAAAWHPAHETPDHGPVLCKTLSGRYMILAQTQRSRIGDTEETRAAHQDKDWRYLTAKYAVAAWLYPPP